MTHTSTEQSEARIVELEAEIERLRKLHQDAYQRGFQAGSRGLREAYDAVQEVRRQDAWGNTHLTEALIAAEERAEARITELEARVQELEASQAPRVPLPESIPPSPTLWALLTKGMTRKAIELLSSERDRQMYLDRAAKNWAAIRSECITQAKQGGAA